MSNILRVLPLQSGVRREVVDLTAAPRRLGAPVTLAADGATGDLTDLAGAALRAYSRSEVHFFFSCEFGAIAGNSMIITSDHCLLFPEIYLY